jgi:uncharacterized protein (TIGR03435 family)
MRIAPFPHIMAAGFLTAAIGHAISFQTGIDKRPSFEVATIKPNRSTMGIGSPYSVSGDRFTAIGMTVKSLIGYAYRVKDVQGGPSWVRSDHWDIEAKAHEKIVIPKRTFSDLDHAPDIDALMLQSLLEDRFKLKIQRQKKEFPVYNLVIAKNGPKVTMSEDQSPPAPSASKTFFGELPRGTARKTLNSFEGRAIPIATFVNLLQGNSDRPWINRTNLAGLYDITLKWEREELASESGSGSASPLAGVNLFFGPAFFSAIQDQLGLKLESGKAPFDIIFIINVQKPSEN